MNENFRSHPNSYINYEISGATRSNIIKIPVIFDLSLDMNDEWLNSLVLHTKITIVIFLFKLKSMMVFLLYRRMSNFIMMKGTWHLFIMITLILIIINYQNILMLRIMGHKIYLN